LIYELRISTMSHMARTIKSRESGNFEKTVT
jgi:hypothetical protein